MTLFGENMEVKQSRNGVWIEFYPFKPNSKTFCFTKSELKAWKQNVIRVSKNTTDGLKSYMFPYNHKKNYSVNIINN